MSHPESTHSIKSAGATGLDYEALAETKVSKHEMANASAKPKPLPNEFPDSFSFWETLENGKAIRASAALSDIPISVWLRQTIRMRLRMEGWIPQHGNGQPRT